MVKMDETFWKIWFFRNLAKAMLKNAFGTVLTTNKLPKTASLFVKQRF